MSCFLEMLVQLRSRLAGCRRMMPLSMDGVMDVRRLRSMRVHSRLSQHLGAGGEGTLNLTGAAIRGNTVTLSTPILPMLQVLWYQVAVGNRKGAGITEDMVRGTCGK